MLFNDGYPYFQWQLEELEEPETDTPEENEEEVEIPRAQISWFRRYIRPHTSWTRR